MTVTNRNSTLYTNVYGTGKGLPVDARDRGGRIVPIPFSHTVVSGETGGASALVRDTVNLCVIPKGSMVIALKFVANDVWASAGTNGTLQLGDSGDDDRYLVATELYTAAGGPITGDGKQVNLLAFAGQNYRPTADVIVLAEYRAANPVVGKIFKGCFFVIPEA